MKFTTPQVMGILNLTPDSFFAGSRKQTEAEIIARTQQILSEGGTMIDVGAYSSRPGADDVPQEEEMRRLRRGLQLIRQEAPSAFVSVDTFRADVARMCVEEFGVQLINDISGGTLDAHLMPMVARLQVPYVLMHLQGTPQTMQQQPHYDDLLGEVNTYFQEKIKYLHQLGVEDIILDPGFGFGKTIEHNYQLMAHLADFHQFGKPLLVGVSRKSMIYKLLDSTPQQALNGTTILNTLALQAGAHILRVHDVRECVEVVKLVQKTKASV